MTSERSQEFVKASLRRADKALAAAKLLLEGKELEDSASRAYYAIFHAAIAILSSRGLKAKSHKGVRMLFDKHIVKGNLMDKVFARIFDEAYDLRQIGDYEALKEIAEEKVRDIIDKAGSFISTVKELIRK